MSKEAMKLALEALKSMKETLAEHDEPTTFNEDEAIKALEEALAKQEQGEPAFHGFMDKNDCCVHICYTPWAAGGPNNELPTAYYTTPQQRKPLTEQEFEKLHYEAKRYVVTGLMDIVRIVEAAHGIKE